MHTNDQKPIGELIERFFGRLALSEDDATAVWGQPVFDIPQTIVVDNGGAFSYASTVAGDGEATGEDEMHHALFDVVERLSAMGIQAASMPSKRTRLHAEAARRRVRHMLLEIDEIQCFVAGTLVYSYVRANDMRTAPVTASADGRDDPSHGFSIVTMVDDGYALRRDDTLLATTMADDDVREASGLSRSDRYGLERGDAYEDVSPIYVRIISTAPTPWWT